MCSNPLLYIYCIRLHKIIVILRYEEGQCDDMCAGLGQCVTSDTSINYFKYLLQKKRALQLERKTTRNAAKMRLFVCVLHNECETCQIGQH